MKKISFLLLSVILSMVSIQAFAYDVAVENGNGKTIYYYYVSGTKLQVTSGDNKYSGDINIPANVTIGNNVYSVTSIGNAFQYCSGLTFITIPNSVTSIGDYAFRYCSGLTSITIPNSVTSIGFYAFYGCSGLTSVTIPNSVTSIGIEAFWGCSGLTFITIPNSVTSIEQGAFLRCSGLTSVISLIESPFSFGSSAFSGISSDCVLTVPRGTRDAYITAGWTEDVFKGGVVEAPAIDFADANVKALCVANWDTNGDGELDVVEAAAVTDLGYVFRNKSTITSFDELQYFTGLTSIGEYVFSGCSGLTSITIPNSVTSIGDYAFNGCSGLTSITIPNSVTSIGNSAFLGCSGLTSITIPNSVTSIGINAFSYCSGLTSITIAKGNTVYDSRGNCNGIIETASNTLVSGCRNTIIPNSVTSIGGDAFSGCSGLTSITIPNSVTSIGLNPFLRCSGLTSIIVEEGNTVYDSRNNCNAIVETASNTLVSGCKNTVISNSVTSIGAGAFYGCSGLTSIAIPNSVTSIGIYAFRSCSGLTSITIPNSVTSIGDWTFAGCSGLTSITIPNSVTSIGGDAFWSCSSLTSITIPNSVTSIGNEAFYKCSGLTSITIPNSVTSIGEGVFLGCSGLTSINIPNSVTSIGDYAFLGCSGLTSISVAVDNTVYDSRDNCNAIIKTASNTLVTGCKNTVIPNSVTCIGDWAFGGCSGLTSITIPNSVTSIGVQTFMECSGLTSITIPNSVTSIGNNAFEDCSSLTSVISLIESPYSYGNSAFSGISSDCVLTVPLGTRDAYIAAGWTEDVFKGGVVDVMGANNKLVVSDTEICLGKRRNLSIELQNETNVTAIQFDIVLPDGFSIAENQNGKLIVSKTSRCSDHTLSTAKQNENTYRVLLYSVDVDEITGNSGTVLNVTLETADNIAEGAYEVRLSNINLTMPDETKIMPADATCTFTVRDVISGDSNGDGVVDVTDIVGIANAILGRAGNTFDPLAADLNGDGVFDVTDIVVLANLILHGNSQPGVKAFNISDLLDPQ